MQSFELVLKNEKRRSYRRVILFITVISLVGIIFAVLNKAWTILGAVAILWMLFYLLYRVSIRTLVLTVDSNKISYPSFPARLIHWNEVSNLILKDGLLTLDFKDNRIIQQATDPEVDAPPEKEFNDFCSQQLKG